MQSASTSARILIVDPVCGSAIGHNYKTTIKYAEWLKRELALESEIWIPKSNCDPAEASVPVRMNIEWIFESLLPTKNRTLLAFTQRFARRVRQIFPRSKLIGLALLPLKIAFHIGSLYQIKRTFLRAFKVNSAAIFLPGADFYSIAALLELAKEDKIPHDQLIILRLMGVMETASHIPGTQNSYVQSLQLLMAYNLQISVTAETEKYASQLEKAIKVRVPVTHIPVTRPIVLDQSESGDDHLEDAMLNICCLGGARADKGYFEICHFANRVRLLHGKSIHFTVQRMSPKSLEFNAAYEVQLSKCPNVSLLPSHLSDHELFDLIGRSDAIFLPYSVGTYAGRGSAILFDTLPFGKMIIGRHATGFGDTIDSKGLGETFHDYESFDAAIKILAQRNAEYKRSVRLRQARYLVEANDNLKEIFSDAKVMRIY